MDISNFIYLYRAKHDLSMQDMANICGLSKAYIGLLEKGINPKTQKPVSPTFQILKKIAKGIGVDMQDFIRILNTPKENVRLIFCENLNRLISEKNVTQREIANAIGVSYPTINHWVKGNKIPRMDKIDKLCYFFACTRSDLMEKYNATNRKDDFSDYDRKMIRAYHKASDIDKKVVDLVLQKYFTC